MSLLAERYSVAGSAYVNHNYLLMSWMDPLPSGTERKHGMLFVANGQGLFIADDGIHYLDWLDFRPDETTAPPTREEPQ